MRIADQIPDKQKQQLEKMKSPKKKEYLSTNDVKDLMKPSTPILHRKRGGAWGN